MVGSDTVGGDPKTDHASLTTDTGGDPKTVHSLGFGGDSPHLGGWQPKLPLLILLPALFSRFSAQIIPNMLMDSQLRIFQQFVMDSRVQQRFLKVAMVCRGQEIPFTWDQNT